ncbi:hypothetical protein DPEC_G00205880 [Dallia pectoralis]|uniref:Uncharacterized protein n=1 Tax=Dallia pectoralis TaxID=75939 RepID=A0ACC2G4K7_DALPE|nr:hypothetical protein DPEC_G00205880 [Dallia pectoralis]
MASVTAVGHRQLRSAPNQQLFHSKLTVTGKKKSSVPTKPPLEKMMVRNSSLRECGSASAVSVNGISLNLSLIAGVATAGIDAGNPGVKCGTHPGLVPRSSDTERDSSCPESGHTRRDTTDTMRGDTMRGDTMKGDTTRDTMRGDTMRDTTARRENETGPSGKNSTGTGFVTDEGSSLTGTDNTFSTSDKGEMGLDNCTTTSATANGHTRAHRNRSVRRRKSFSPPVGETVRETDETHRLDRLTQGRTGVVKLARTEPHRREAWAIFTRNQDPRVRPETGDGHLFRTRTVKQDWCDVCNQRISALQALKCTRSRLSSSRMLLLSHLGISPLQGDRDYSI